MAKVAHLKGPEKEGNREPVYFATHADYVEGLKDKLDTQAEATPTKAGLMSSADKSKLDSVENNYVPRTKPTAFSISTSEWTKNNSETSEFIYYADITVSGLTSNDYAEINFNRASQNIIVEANICASGETLSGKIRLFAEKIPTAVISGEYVITKGAV